MSDGIDPQNQTANAETAAPAPAIETEVTTAVTPESAPAAEPTPAEPKKPEEPGSEPEGSPKVVEELKSQRAKRQAAEREAAYWRGRAEAAQPQPAPVVSEEKEPVLDDFDGPTAYEDWIAARTEYRIEKKQKSNQVVQQTQSRLATIDQSYKERCEKAGDEIPDFLDVVNSAQIPVMPDEVVTAVKESELGPKIVYHFAKNPTDARRIAALSPWAAVREIGKLEAKLTAATPREPSKTSQAPEPIQRTVAGKTEVDNDLSNLPTNDYIERRNRELNGK